MRIRVDFVYAILAGVGLTLGFINTAKLGPECGWTWFLLSGVCLSSVMFMSLLSKRGKQWEDEAKRLKDKYENK